MITIRSDIVTHTNDSQLVRRGETHWQEHARESGDGAIMRFARDALADSSLGPLLRGVFANSPFLTQELAGNIPLVREIMEHGPDIAFERTLTELQMLPAAQSTITIMAALRQAKRRGALVAGLADIAGVWPLEAVTGALTRIAEATLGQAVTHVLSTPAFARLPQNQEGLVILGMGKLGARELNYSSDIDLIVFFDDAQIDRSLSGDIGETFTRLARALVRMMEERTGDGYVFRTDLRLRPDPASTPLAVSLSAAEVYYGSLGQNWERAAMIKARQVVGDPAAGDALFAFLRPWIWRRNLDFAAIEDIHSIKRQINLHKLKPTIEGLLGHNVKLGRGGIREIEFYTQTQQLIFGGRDTTLRAPGTCDALSALAKAHRIDQQAADELTVAYRFLRTVEHRLQMVDDQQTHSLPETEEGMERIAGFMGFADKASFVAELETHLSRVQERFSALFGSSPSLSGSGSLVFTGVEDDPETLKTLAGLGYANASGVAATIRGWHHGRYRATRSERARELLTKLTPDLLDALAGTADPDTSFFRFDAFLAALSGGVMLLALLTENLPLLGLMGRIIGTAPTLAEQLGQNPALFDDLLTEDFFAPLPDLTALTEDLDRMLALAQGYEDALIRLRRWVAGRKFQAGVHILESISDGVQAGRFLAAIAEASIRRVLPLTEAEFESRYGAIPGGSFSVVALGRLGGGLMSFTSDLDLITLYDAPEDAVSNTAKPLDAAPYYMRLTQRLIAAISAPMAEGRLYDVDLRLRPSGDAGPVATSLTAFRRYHATSSWTWEHMALTRARVVAGPPRLAAAVDEAIREVLTTPRNPAKLLKDVADMRDRIGAEHPPQNRWHLKYTPGGMVDVEFVVQYLLLRHGNGNPGLLTTDIAEAIARLTAGGYLSAAAAGDLDHAALLAWRIQGLIRLTTDDVFDPGGAPAVTRAMLTREIAHATGRQPGQKPEGDIDFRQAESILDSILNASRARYDEIVAGPAAALPPSSNPTRLL
jgi:glutamate-ammonia-ligase adenylyltransferase